MCIRLISVYFFFFFLLKLTRNSSWVHPWFLLEIFENGENHLDTLLCASTHTETFQQSYTDIWPSIKYNLYIAIFPVHIRLQQTCPPKLVVAKVSVFSFLFFYFMWLISSGTCLSFYPAGLVHLRVFHIRCCLASPFIIWGAWGY